jgi:hypothetical protein
MGTYRYRCCSVTSRSVASRRVVVGAATVIRPAGQGVTVFLPLPLLGRLGAAVAILSGLVVPSAAIGRAATTASPQMRLTWIGE